MSSCSAYFLFYSLLVMPSEVVFSDIPDLLLNFLFQFCGPLLHGLLIRFSGFHKILRVCTLLLTSQKIVTPFLVSFAVWIGSCMLSFTCTYIHRTTFIMWTYERKVLITFCFGTEAVFPVSCQSMLPDYETVVLCGAFFFIFLPSFLDRLFSRKHNAFRK